MPLQVAENELFAKWGKQYTTFFKDGAAPSFATEKLKLLFVLKDGNAPADLDLRDFLHWGAHGYTWNNCARWAALILDRADWSAVVTPTEEGRSKYLSRVAAMNLKKEHGEGTVTPADIWRAVIRDAEFIKEQVNIYRPHVTVAGGTFDYLVHLYKLAPETISKHPGSFTFAEHPDLGMVVKMDHPQARKGANPMFKTLEQGIESLRLSGRWPEPERKPVPQDAKDGMPDGISSL